MQENLKKRKQEIIDILLDDNYCITFNKNQDIPIWNYMLSEDKTIIFVYDEEDTTIYDGLVIEAPDDVFNHGDSYKKVSFKGINIPENIVTRNNFYLFEKQFK